MFGKPSIERETKPEIILEMYHKALILFLVAPCARLYRDFVGTMSSVPHSNRRSHVRHVSDQERSPMVVANLAQDKDTLHISEPFPTLPVPSTAMPSIRQLRRQSR